MNGWVKLHRDLLDKPIWTCSTIEQKVILITILLMANHKEKEWEWKGEKFICKAGQFVTSASSIAKNAGIGISRQNIRTALARFEKYEFLTIESTNKNSLITICNWESYQSEPDVDNQQTNQRLTSNQPTPNQRLTTNKNVRMKEYNISTSLHSVDNRAKRTAFVPPTLEEVKIYVREKEYAFVDAERFFDFYESKGWMVGKNKMKDWKAAIRNWHRGNRANQAKQVQARNNNINDEW